MLRKKNWAPNQFSPSFDDWEQLMKKLCQNYASNRNNGPAYLLSNVCMPELKNAISIQCADLYIVHYCFMWATANESCITFGKSDIIGELTSPLGCIHVTEDSH